MLFDTLCDAIEEIEWYEENYPESYADSAEGIRRVKLEIVMLQLRFRMVPPVAETVTTADLDWIRAEALRRGAERAPYEFDAVFTQCMHDFWKKWKKRKANRNLTAKWRRERSSVNDD